jgi:hypothetical protein
MAKTIDDLLKRFAGLRSQYSERDMRYEANWYAYRANTSVCSLLTLLTR